MLKTLRQEVDQHIRELNEHRDLICYKIDLDEAVVAQTVHTEAALTESAIGEASLTEANGTAKVHENSASSDASRAFAGQA